MRNLLTALLSLVLALPAVSRAQEASAHETQAVSTIVECLVAGLPDDWRRVEVVVELEKPGAETGNVQYQVWRADAPDQAQAFEPCDVGKPARTLIEARKQQAADRRGWNSARLVLQRDGKFALNYAYPKQR